MGSAVARPTKRMDRLEAAPRSGNLRRALTLVEFLVVVVLLLAFSVVAISVLFVVWSDATGVPAATRLVVQGLRMARERAMATGRIYGVRLVREEGRPNSVRILQFVATPDPFSEGHVFVRRVTTTQAEVRPVGGDPLWDYVDPGPDPNSADDDVPRVVVGQAWIRFDYAGPLYLVEEVGRDTQGLYMRIRTFPGTPLPHETTQARSYQIFNPPRLDTVPALSLPVGTYIDVGLNPQLSRGIPNQDPSSGRPMDILFAPTGQIVGEAALRSYIKFWITTERRNSDENADYRVVALSARTGTVSVFQPGLADPDAAHRAVDRALTSSIVPGLLVP